MSEKFNRSTAIVHFPKSPLENAIGEFAQRTLGRVERLQTEGHSEAEAWGMIEQKIKDRMCRIENRLGLSSPMSPTPGKLVHD